MATAIKERLAAAQAKALTAEALLTKEVLADLEDLAEIARAEARERDALERAMSWSLAGRLAAAQAKAPGAVLRTLHIEGTSHSFVLMSPGQKAFLAWEKATFDEAYAKALKKRPEVERVSAAIEYAAASVVDFDGMTDFTGATENGDALIKFLQANPAIRREVETIAHELVKLASEERKSTG